MERMGRNEWRECRLLKDMVWRGDRGVYRGVKGREWRERVKGG